MKLAQGTTVIRHGQLVDGNGDTPLGNAIVQIQDGLIRYAGPSQGGAGESPRCPPD